MRLLTFSFLTFLNILIFSSQIQAQEFLFSIPNNHISFTNHVSAKIVKNSESSTAVINHEPDDCKANFYLLSQNQKFNLREIINDQAQISIDNFYQLNLPEEPLLALTFEYALETDEDLKVFDEPVFYVALESETSKELIFAKTIEQSQDDWQKVVLDLRNFSTSNKKIVFYVGNLGDTQKTSQIFLRNLSSQLIIWRIEDQIFFKEEKLNNFNDYLQQGFIKINEEIWPIYQFTSMIINDFTSIAETDSSLSIILPPFQDEILHNHQYLIQCQELNHQLISQSNYYLLPEFTITDFWPNYADKIILNIPDFFCADFDDLSLEVL